MAPINEVTLEKRLFYYSNGTTNGARWAFFALFILLILFLLFYTLRVNKRRLRTGSKPIAGTAWMTPPSYYQSQSQYNQPMNSNNVPPYSENTLPNDAGYYDQQGNFIANPGYEPQQPPKGAGYTNAVVSDDTGEQYERPSVPPPAHVNESSSSRTNDYELEDFTRPTNPPPRSGA